MSLYPCRQNLKPYDPGTDPEIVPWMFIAHVAVYNQPGIDEGPSFHSGLEWHFYIDKGPGKPEDIITQLRDTKYQADSSYMANGFWVQGQFCGAVSFESEGTGDDPWTDAQIDAIIWLFRKANEIDGIPLMVCPAWNQRGLGYHRLFSQWNSPYHSCPGDQKVHQFDTVIMPALMAPPEPEKKKVYDMTPGQCRDKTGRKWFFVVGDGLQAFASVDGGEFFELVGGGQWTSGLDAMCEEDGLIVVGGRGTDGALYQMLVYTDGGPPSPNKNNVEVIKVGGHIFPAT